MSETYAEFRARADRIAVAEPARLRGHMVYLPDDPDRRNAVLRGWVDLFGFPPADAMSLGLKPPCDHPEHMTWGLCPSSAVG
jgi:hypothetical protein